MQLKLFHKGLFLVAALMAFEFLFVGSMAFLLHDAEVEAARLAKSKEIIDSTNGLFDTLNEINKVFGQRGLNSRTLDDPQFIEAQNSVPARFAHIRALVKANSEQVTRLDHAEKLVNQSNALLLDLKKKADEGLPRFILLGQINDTLNQLKYLRDAMYSDLLSVMHEERAVEESSPQAQAQMRENQKKLLLIAMAVNLAFAVALTMLFSRGITRRLEVMLDNTLRLARRDPLNPRVGGSDEIAQLDRVFHDVADALAEADRKEAELAQLKREFVAMASHELRTPLTSVQGTLSMATQGVFGAVPEQLSGRLVESEANIDRLIKLINDVLDIEKMQSGKLSFQSAPTKAQELVSASVSAVEQFATMNNVSITADKTETVVEVDKDRVIQVMINLLSNAVKYSTNGSAVDIKVSEQDKFLRIAVIDKGPGIPADYKEIIFDRFQQVDAEGAPKKPGSGLGLAICKAIVDQHGGTIGVDSTLGQGSEFWFTLPKRIV